jgi:hypothetical protein
MRTIVGLVNIIRNSRMMIEIIIEMNYSAIKYATQQFLISLYHVLGSVGELSLLMEVVEVTGVFRTDIGRWI